MCLNPLWTRCRWNGNAHTPIAQNPGQERLTPGADAEDCQGREVWLSPQPLDIASFVESLHDDDANPQLRRQWQNTVLAGTLAHVVGDLNGVDAPTTHDVQHHRIGTGRVMGNADKPDAPPIAQPLERSQMRAPIDQIMDLHAIDLVVFE